MRIKEFKHDKDKGYIEFNIERNDSVHLVRIEKTVSGTIMTDYDEFTSNWSSGEYYQLDDFINACSGMLHQFYHC